MAQYLLDASLGGTSQLASAGTGALVGYPPADDATAVMSEHGYDISSHRAQLLSDELLRWADLVLVMEPRHRTVVQEMDPTARGKTFLLGHWQGERPIDDPIGKDAEAFEQAYQAINAAVATWADRLKQ